MALNSTSFCGLPTHILSQVEQYLQGPVSRELHAFCHLCPPDAPAATELLRLSKEELSHLSRACKEAINQWCSCARDYEAQPGGPSLTTQNSALIAKICTALIDFSLVKRRITNMVSPDSKSRRVLRSHWTKSDYMSRSSHFSVFSRKKTAEGYTRDLESLRDVLGA